MSLFSAFVPESGILFLPLNWVQIFVPVLLVPSMFWVAQNQLSGLFGLGLRAVEVEVRAVLSPAAGMPAFFVSVFAFVVLINFSGLSPYIFTASSHLSFTLSLALPIWAGHMAWSILFAPQSVLQHLIPLGTPSPLIPVMCLIELTSSVIRPLTLSIRLFANITAGHLLLALTGGPAFTSNMIVLMAIFGALIVLSVLEVAVSLIQGYVFTILSALYVAEVPTNKFV